MRRKSFSLPLLILVTLLIILLVILSLYLINRSGSSKKVSSKDNDTSSEQTIDSNEQSQNQFSSEAENGIIDSLQNIDGNENTEQPSSTESNEQNSNEENQEQQAPEQITLNLNSHTYKFDNGTDARITENSDPQELQITNTEHNFKILFYSDASKSFDSLKSEQNLKDYIESTYHTSITGNLKTGTVNNLQLIIGVTSDDNGQAYILFTPLTDSEVAYAKIYNTQNSAELVSDLSDALNQVSSIISSKE